MLSPFSVLKDAFAVFRRNFLSILTVFSSLFCVFSFVQFIGSVSSIFFATSVLNTDVNIDFSRFNEIAFLPSTVISVFAFFVLFLPLFLGAERMSLKWVSGEKPPISELLWAYKPRRFLALFILHLCLFLMLFVWSVAAVFPTLVFSADLSALAATFLNCIFYGIGVCGGVVIITFFLAASLVFVSENSLKSALLSALGKGSVKGLFSSLLPLVTAFLPLVLFGGFFILFVPLFVLISAVIFDRAYLKKRSGEITAI